MVATAWAQSPNEVHTLRGAYKTVKSEVEAKKSRRAWQRP